ncbi:MAG: carboxypeptidase-like regulatory domain-containing protein [Acidobacteria bacterium]|nr:carboxypeptidase-like regulatory domain-containing protein [Acidobacteriota bacterium]
MERKAAALAFILTSALAALPSRAVFQDRADELAGPAPGGITGRVMDARGGPLSGAKVVLHRGEFSATTQTDDQGDYCFCRVKPARDYVFEIALDGFAGFMERDFSVARSKLSIRNVILEPLSRFRPDPGKEESP